MASKLSSVVYEFISIERPVPGVHDHTLLLQIGTAIVQGKCMQSCNACVACAPGAEIVHLVLFKTRQNRSLQMLVPAHVWHMQADKYYSVAGDLICQRKSERMRQAAFLD